MILMADYNKEFGTGEICPDVYNAGFKDPVRIFIGQPRRWLNCLGCRNNYHLGALFSVLPAALVRIHVDAGR